MNRMATSIPPLIRLSTGQYENTDDSRAVAANTANPTVGALSLGKERLRTSGIAASTTDAATAATSISAWMPVVLLNGSRFTNLIVEMT